MMTFITHACAFLAGGFLGMLALAMVAAGRRDDEEAEREAEIVGDYSIPPSLEGRAK